MRPRRTIQKTRFAFFPPPAQPLIRRLARHPSCFRSVRDRPSPRLYPIHQQATPERCQPGFTMRHEGLPTES